MNRDINDVAGSRWALGGSALAAGMSGDLARCEVALAALGSAAPPPIQLFELDLVDADGPGRSPPPGSGRQRSPTCGPPPGAPQMPSSSSPRRCSVTTSSAWVTRDHGDPPRALVERIDGELTAVLAAHCRALISGVRTAIEDVGHRFASWASTSSPPRPHWTRLAPIAGTDFGDEPPSATGGRNR